ncbi:glutamate racemase [Clostridium argentinense CDC 2741]|uniref:Glutamate racemase n=1 Tax=Clostridium argentinense CDC 2741 TaxID=1418104 RepID=A0A0C1R7F6_9CLOT|nr:glutamate racemase [Clostridium argentinense]ARC85017.1 glutamate racemase [Clostridium argentinense]KIE46446.1 glutamate racemase [Clostridium argentinense CDC 2741]NFF40454.1 glutamate racemase [Clostridium argentinense]NFP50529.1 glutamate racemase [Clostridium argentinense]NFP72865.1 glutamate racemase [Clostridium argentinense]
MKIGFFDSGIGGITVLHEALKMLPHEDYLYYADTSNVPYGPKPKNEVKKYIFDAIEFIISQEVKAIVIACNTATSIAIEDLRAKYNIPIIGMEPAVKPAVEINKNTNKRILVTGTALTLKENKLRHLITRLNNEHIVDLLPLPGLVQFSEKFEFNEEIILSYLKEQLNKYDLNNYETIVLGCTHFSFYKNMFKKLFPSNINIIDGNIGTVRNLERTLKEMNSLDEGNGNITFFNSGFKIEDKTKLDKYSELFRILDDINF